MRHVFVAVCIAAAVGPANSASCVPVFGEGVPRVVTIAKGGSLGTSDLGTPRDLAFHPITNDLWVASAHGSATPNSRYGGNFIIKNPGTPEQSTTLLRDRVPFHYNDNLAAIAFSDDGRAVFTCQESLNVYTGLAQPNFFQGPTTFQVYPCKGGYGRPPKSFCAPGPQSAPNCGKTDECDVLTVTNDGKDGTGCEKGSTSCFVMHSDMLHEAPLCMGIAYDNGATTSDSLLVTPAGDPISTWNRTRVRGNTVWYVDGLRGRLMRFDMDELHDPKNLDHRKANIRRYLDVQLTRREGVPGHLIVDTTNNHLYISDTGARRILRVRTTSGQLHRGAMCNNPLCYPHSNTYYTCGKSNPQLFPNISACQAYHGCRNAPDSCFRDIENRCPRADGGWCHFSQECVGVHADLAPGGDDFGCYNTFTEMGYLFECELWGCTDYRYLFEYELWGCTDYEVFSTALKSPTGIALTPDGRVLVADYDTGDIVAFDKTGAELNRFATGKVGVGGLAVKCVPQADGAGGGAGGGDTNCRLWFTNLVEKTVAYISLDVPCSGAAAAAALPGAPAAFRSPVLLLRDKISCRSDASAKAVVSSMNARRPDFYEHNGATWQNPMFIPHSYGKDCTQMPKASLWFDPCSKENCLAVGLGDACVGTVQCRVGANGYKTTAEGVKVAWVDGDAVQCPDRLDCSAMNLDLLVMAGFYCHPCIPNPCENAGVCTNAPPRQGFTCSCPTGYAGNVCHINTKTGACPPLRAFGGQYTPPAVCQVAGQAQQGQACVLQCANDKYMRVGKRAVALLAAAPPALEEETMLRTCSTDASTRSPAWVGSEAACICRPNYFGQACQRFVAAWARKEALVGSEAATLEVENGRYAVGIPGGAVSGSVTVVLSVFKLGITFGSSVTISMALSDQAEVNEGQVALFYWDPFANSWAELTGSEFVKGAKCGGDTQASCRIVRGKSTHFSRWIVLEKPAEGQGVWKMWVGIAVAILVTLAAIFYGANRYMSAGRNSSGLVSQKAPPADAERSAKSEHAVTLGNYAPYASPQVVIEAENAAPPAARTLEQLSSSEDFRVEMLNRGLGAKGAQSPTPVSEAHLGDTLLPVPVSHAPVHGVELSHTQYPISGTPVSWFQTPPISEVSHSPPVPPKRAVDGQVYTS